MKRLIIFLAIVIPGISFPQNPTQQNTNEEWINTYFESIRHSEAQLRSFFQSMPKGADLHHHYYGSVYAETYLKSIENEDLWVHTETIELSSKKPIGEERQYWSRVSTLKEEGTWHKIKLKIIRSWSIKYYNNQGLPPDEHFFATFRNFSIPMRNTYREGILEIKNRAIKENTSYIETMFTGINFKKRFDFEDGYNKQLIAIQEAKSDKLEETLETLYQYYVDDPEYLEFAKEHNESIEKLHNDLKLDSENFKMRYQNYVIRVMPPVQVFKNLLICFKSAELSDLIVGVNIVAPENNEISMRDYWLHMRMFRFLKSKHPDVKYSLHAGELVLGLVQPEELTWHIEDAVKTAEAMRIGHGVDIMYENNAAEILAVMRARKIAVEINFSSNAFILGIAKDEHPFMLYEKSEVPIVISTDDAGVLRTDLTQQYVILARDYAAIDYRTIKKYVFNSIEYSFLDEKLKNELRNKLIKDFQQFENKIKLNSRQQR